MDVTLGNELLFEAGVTESGVQNAPPPTPEPPPPTPLLRRFRARFYWPPLFGPVPRLDSSVMQWVVEPAL